MAGGAALCLASRQAWLQSAWTLLVSSFASDGHSVGKVGGKESPRAAGAWKAIRVMVRAILTTIQHEWRNGTSSCHSYLKTTVIARSPPGREPGELGKG